MTSPSHPSSRGPRAIVVAFLGVIFMVLAGGQARADIPPSCDTYDSLITCAATDVGKNCQTAGKCFEIHCASGAGAGSTACPTILVGPNADCDFSNLGKACSGPDAAAPGTCGVVPTHCQVGNKFGCMIPAAEKPTGPPQPMFGGKNNLDNGGCDIAPGPGKPAMIGLGLVAAGLAFLFFDRARRRSR
jgi:hypothetical protein